MNLFIFRLELSSSSITIHMDVNVESKYQCCPGFWIANSDRNSWFPPPCHEIKKTQLKVSRMPLVVERRSVSIPGNSKPVLEGCQTNLSCGIFPTHRTSPWRRNTVLCASLCMKETAGCGVSQWYKVTFSRKDRKRRRVLQEQLLFIDLLSA